MREVVPAPGTAEEEIPSDCLDRIMLEAWKRGSEGIRYNCSVIGNLEKFKVRKMQFQFAVINSIHVHESSVRR